MLRLPRNHTLQKINSYRYFCNKSPTISGHYDVVIAGGGITGTSVGFHLSKHSSGIKPLLLEQSSLTSGTTWHAASLLGTIRGTGLETAISRYTNYYLREIENETGFSPSFKNCGAITLACTPKRMEMLQRIKALCHSRNIDVDMISTHRANELCPYLDYSDVIGALHITEDSSCTSSDVVQCYAKGMQQNGGKILENCRIIDMKAINYGLGGFKIKTNCGDITCDYFVNCAGQWAKQLGYLCDVNIPLASCEHFYIVSMPNSNLPKVDTMMPVVRDPDAKNGYVYFREWSGGILSGSFERKSKIAFDGDEYHNLPPENFSFGLFDDDWDHFEPMMDAILHRCPMFENAEIQMVNGPESFTIDIKHLVGEIPELFNYYVAAGLNSAGIASSGGIGKLLSNWIIYNDPTYYDGEYKYKNPKLYEIEKQLFSSWPTASDIKRFHPYSKNINVQVNGAKEAVGDHVPIQDSFGVKSRKCVMNIRSSPCYHYQKYKQNGYFVADTKDGYSIAAFFGEFDGETESIYSLPTYQGIVDKELEMYSNGTSMIFDRSVDTKWLLTGKDVNKLFCDSDKYEIIQSNDISNRINGVCSVIVKNRKSENIEFMADLWKLNEDRYMVQCVYYEFYSYLHKQCIAMNDKTNIKMEDVSSQFCVFHVVGNNALIDLMSLCHSSCSDKLNTLKNGNNHTFEWIDIGSFSVAISGNIKHSQNFCCESNEYRILVSSEYAPHFYELLCESEMVNIKPAGYFVWDMIRISNGIAKYNVDFDATYFKKIKQQTHDLIKGTIVLNDSYKSKLIPFGGEPIVNDKDDECFGYISSIRYRGNAFDKMFIANVNTKCFTEQQLKIRVGDSYVDCEIQSLIDLPSGEKIKQF